MFGRMRDRQSMRVMAYQQGMFKSREGIYHYFVTYEGLTPAKALEQTEIECKGRGIPDGPVPKPEPSGIASIQNDVMNYAVNYVKENPGKAISEILAFLGGAASTGIGFFTGAKAASDDVTVNVEVNPSAQQSSEPEEVVSIDDLMAEQPEEVGVIDQQQ